MSSSNIWQSLVSLVSNDLLLQRLCFASIEFAVLALVVWGIIRLTRIKAARLISLLWLVVLTKPIVSLIFGSPFPVLRLDKPSAATQKISGNS